MLKSALGKGCNVLCCSGHKALIMNYTLKQQHMTVISSVEECLTRDRGAAGSSLFSVTVEQDTLILA